MWKNLTKNEIILLMPTLINLRQGVQFYCFRAERIVKQSRYVISCMEYGFTTYIEYTIFMCIRCLFACSCRMHRTCLDASHIFEQLKVEMSFWVEKIIKNIGPCMREGVLRYRKAAVHGSALMSNDKKKETAVL